MPESASPPRRCRASIGEVMGLVALAALACVWPGLIPTEVVAVLMWLAARGGSGPARGRLASLGVVLAAVYLCPLANFVLIPLLDPAWSQFGPAWRRDWSPFFPITPGILPVVVVDGGTGLGALVRRMSPHAVDFMLAFLASLATAAIVYALTLLADQSRGRRALAAMLGFLWSAFSTVAMTVVVMSSSV
jgi:hypothetical protein